MKKIFKIIGLVLCIVIALTPFCLTVSANEVSMATVSFNTNGGSLISSVSVSIGSTVNCPQNPHKDESIFDGWLLEGEKYNFNTQVTKDITLVAKWIDLAAFISVTFDFNNGSDKFVQRIKENSSVVEPMAPIKEGYVFTGFTLSGEKFDFNTKIDSNITLVASYELSTEKLLKVEFDTLGGSLISDKYLKEKSKLSIPNNPTKKGYDFVGWYLNNELFDLDSLITEDITLVAKWEKTTDTVVISFDLGINGDSYTQEIRLNTQVIKPVDPTKSGYRFLGWEFSNAEFDFDSLITEDITIKALWVKTYNVYLKNGFNDEIIDVLEIDENTTISSIKTPTYLDYTFDRWLLDEEEFNFETIIKSDLTLTASWCCNPFIVTVDFDTDGGSLINSQQVVSSTKISKPTNPVKPGFVFDCWLLDEEEFDFDMILDCNIVLVASYKKLHSVFLNTNGGNYIGVINIIDKETINNTYIPVKSGYTFKYWADESGVEFNFETEITSDMMLTAIYEEVNSFVVVKFISDGNEKYNSQIILKNSKILEPISPTKEGFVFDGWYLNGELFDFSSNVTQDIELVAKFK